jgi:predicted nucleic acid-binding protein
MPFVVDASATLPWCFEDEATPWTESILDRVSNNEQIHAPAHWPVEVSNGLLMATRRNRIPPGRADAFLDKLFLLPISIAPPLTRSQCLEVLVLCDRFKLGDIGDRIANSHSS